MTNLKDLIETAFRITAPTYWGAVDNVEVIENYRPSGGKTVYHLVMADTRKKGQHKLFQEWFMNKNGTPQPNINRTLLVPIDYADEIGQFLFDEFKVEE